MGSTLELKKMEPGVGKVEVRKEQGTGGGVVDRVGRVLGRVSVEPAALLYSLGTALITVQVANLYIEKVCKVGSALFGNGTTYSDEVRDEGLKMWPGVQQPVQWVLSRGTRGGPESDGSC